jgi:toxin ParE1/3/4
LNPVRLTKVAEREIAHAAKWYERKREGLGAEFVGRVRQAVEQIAENPQGYALLFRDLRRANFRQFPYALWFQVRPDKSLVVACLHGKRSPTLAKERRSGVVEKPRKPPGPSLM